MLGASQLATVSYLQLADPRPGLRSSNSWLPERKGRWRDKFFGTKLITLWLGSMNHGSTGLEWSACQLFRSVVWCLLSSTMFEALDGPLRDMLLALADPFSTCPTGTSQSTVSCTY